jgi:hypothetical protein
MLDFRLVNFAISTWRTARSARRGLLALDKLFGKGKQIAGRRGKERQAERPEESVQCAEPDQQQPEQVLSAKETVEKREEPRRRMSARRMEILEDSDELTFEADDSGTRLDVFLARACGESRAQIQRLNRRGSGSGGRPARKANYLIARGESVSLRC